MIPLRDAALCALFLVLFGSAAASQEENADGQEAPLDAQDVNSRLDALERENQELERQIGVLADEQERIELGSLVPPVGDSEYGLGPAASKVYSIDSGLSIGGYGEGLYQDYSTGSKLDQADLLRFVLYFGYRFNDDWVLNSEIELEHASTSKSGEVSVEFAYLDYLYREEVNARVGLVLLPMGFLNELHEPTTFLTATRPEVERKIIPSTWRENGVGVFGDIGPLSYRGYVVNGLDATGFSSGGLRGGRQKGSKALAEELAVVGRVDWTDTPGLLVGGSAYHGSSGQNQAGLLDTSTTIGEAHVEWKARGLWTRALYTMASVGDVTALNNALMLTGGESVGERLSGWYAEVGYDVMSLVDPEGQLAVTPYARYEWLDTQERVPAGFTSDPATDVDILTVGFQVRPIDQLVFKFDYQDFEHGQDRFNASIGYIF